MSTEQGSGSKRKRGNSHDCNLSERKRSSLGHSSHGEDDRDCTIRVSGLPGDAKEEQVVEFFKTTLLRNRDVVCGIVGCKIVSPGRAVVEFENAHQAERAVSLDNFRFGDKIVDGRVVSRGGKAIHITGHCVKRHRLSVENNGKHDPRICTVQVCDIPRGVRGESIILFFEKTLHKYRDLRCEVKRCHFVGMDVATVEFFCPEHATRALTLDKFKILPRQVKRITVDPTPELALHIICTDQDICKTYDDEAERSPCTVKLSNIPLQVLEEDELVNFFASGHRPTGRQKMEVKRCAFSATHAGTVYIHFASEANAEIACKIEDMRVRGAKLVLERFNVAPSASNIRPVSVSSSIFQELENSSGHLSNELPASPSEPPSSAKRQADDKLAACPPAIVAIQRLDDRSQFVEEDDSAISKDRSITLADAAEKTRQLVSVQVENRRLRRELNNVPAAAHVHNLNNKIQHLESEIEKLNAIRVGQEIALESQQSSSDDLSSRLTAAKATIEKLQAENGRLALECDAIRERAGEENSGKSEEREATLQSLRSQVAEANDRFLKLADTLSSQTDILKEQHETTKELRQKLASEKLRRQNLEQELKELHAKQAHRIKEE